MVSFIGVGVAVIVFLTAPSSAARTSLVVAPSFGTNGASLALSGRF